MCRSANHVFSDGGTFDLDPDLDLGFELAFVVGWAAFWGSGVSEGLGVVVLGARRGQERRRFRFSRLLVVGVWDVALSFRTGAIGGLVGFVVEVEDWLSALLGFGSSFVRHRCRERSSSASAPEGFAAAVLSVVAWGSGEDVPVLEGECLGNVMPHSRSMSVDGMVAEMTSVRLPVQCTSMSVFVLVPGKSPSRK